MVHAPVASRQRSVEIPAAGTLLNGILELPDPAVGLVLFAHGSGSSRFSPRNQRVAIELGRSHLGTLLFDLLSEEEERLDAATARYRFDIPRLAARLVAATDWTRRQPELAGLPLGYFGSSTGAAAALLAAADRREVVRAVVSRGGRPDLAGDALRHVRAPTLLVVGALDAEVLALNRHAQRELAADSALEIVPGATHLFEEPGMLEQVAQAAARWFVRHFASGAEGR